MASSYSILRNFGDYIQPYDLNLIQQGLQYKQGKFDANYAKIQSQIDQISNLDLVKDVDKQYLYERIQNLVGGVNQYGAIDLSSNGITRSIQGHITQALDVNVMNAYASSSEFRKTISTIENVKKNQPDKWSPQNEYDAMEGMQEYLNDENVGASYKGKGYTPFTDVNKILDDRIKNADKYLKNITKRTTPSGDYFYDEYNEVVSPDKIRQLIRGTMTPQLQNQVLIDAKFNMRGLDDSTIRSVAKDSFSNQITELDGVKKLAESDLAGIDSKDPNYTKLKNYIESINGQISDYNTRISDLDKTDSNSLKYNLYYNQLENNFVGLYSGVLRNEQTIRENSIPLRYKQFHEQQRQNDITNAFQQQRLDLARDQFSLDVAKQDYQMKKDGYDPETGTFSGVDGMGNPIAKAGENEDGISTEEKVRTETFNSKNDFKNALLNKGNEDKQTMDDKTFLAVYKVKKSEFTPQNMDKIMSLVQASWSSNPDSKLVPINSELRQKFDRWNHFDTSLKQVNSEIEQSLTTNYNNLIDGIYNATSNKMLSQTMVNDFEIVNENGVDKIKILDTKKPIGQVFGKNENDLNTQLGNTGRTKRDLLMGYLAVMDIQKERENHIGSGDVGRIERMANFANKAIYGTMSEFKRDDNKGFWGTAWDNVSGASKGTFNFVMSLTPFGDQEDIEDKNEGFSKIKGLDTQTGNFLTTVSENVYDANGRLLQDKSTLRDLFDKTGASEFTMYNPKREIKDIFNDYVLGSDSKLEYLDKTDLNKTEDGRWSSWDDRINETEDYLFNAENGRVNKIYESALGMYPQDYAYSVDSKSTTGKTLANIANGKLSLEGESGSVVGNNIVYERNAQGGLDVTVDFGTTKDNEKKTLSFSPDEVPQGLLKSLQAPSYNPAYDARLSTAQSIDYSSTLFRDNQEKLNYSKATGVPLNQLYGENEFRNDLQNYLPPQYRQQFDEKYGAALEYLIDNKSTFSLVPTGDGYYAKQWKVGDVSVGLEPTAIQNLMNEEVSSIYNNGQSTMMMAFKQIILDYGTKGYSEDLDAINNYLREKQNGGR
ncbi:MAG: hypothetical protein KC414_03725 [Romboutsia sp.]|nr:hypothetical protein [Romboutsia sp.]